MDNGNNIDKDVNANGLTVEQPQEQASSKKLLFVGMGYFIKHIITTMCQDWSIVLLDADVENPEVKKYAEIWGDKVELIEGDVNSIVAWKKIPLNDVSHILFSLFSLDDIDVAEEVCRIARGTFKLDIPIIGLANKQKLPDFFETYNVTWVDNISIGVSSIRSLIEKNYATPANIGIGKGEIVEVTVLRRSHLVDRKIRLIESSRWRVVAIYRDGEFIMPNGDSQISIGDKVVLVGDPKMLENLVNIMMHGIPQFPLQYGPALNVLTERDITPMEEANYLRRNIQCRDFNLFAHQSDIDAIVDNNIIKSMSISKSSVISSYKDKDIFTDSGVVMINKKEFSFFNFKMRYFIKSSPAPMLISSGSFPYSSVVVSLNSDMPSQILQEALEVSRLMSLTLRVVYVAPPKDLRNAQLEAELTDRQKIVRDYENLERVKLDYTVMEGNPVKETVAYQANSPRALFVMGNDRQHNISFFDPHTPYLLAGRLSCSLLIIPLKKG